MKNSATKLAVLFLIACFTMAIYGQEPFSRVGTIPADSLDIGGFGEIVTDVDIDGDGNVEIYAVNTDWHDELGLDLIPRIYKYEQNAMGDWETVWSTSLPLDFQNTWSPLNVGDLDSDGKWEVVWGPINNFGSGLQPNPERIVVFETTGDGSDDMGIDNGDGTWAPNAQWTIITANEEDLRPFRWMVTDIDSDGTPEIVSCLRGSAQGFGMQIYSVSDVPDNGDGSETWTVEFEGLDATHWDMTIIGNTAYGIKDNGDVTPVTATGPDTYVQGATQVGVVGAGSWKSAQTVDVDDDGTEEIVVASWSSGTRHVYLLQQSGDTLTSTIINTPPAAAFRLYGGAAGDVDNDGNLDFMFGTRQATPNGLVYRLEYQGGDIADSLNWQLSAIDSLVSDAQQYDIVHTADFDGDGEDEVVYTGIPRGLGSTDPPQPITILKRGTVSIDDNGAPVVEGFELRQNYPNPFNPETTIEFVIPSAENVSLTIYNMLGQKVRSLSNSRMAAGLHSVRWDGLNDRGVRVSSGVYVYTLRAGSFVQSKKMTVMK